MRSEELSSPWEHPSTVVLWGWLVVVLPEWYMSACAVLSLVQS